MSNIPSAVRVCDLHKEFVLPQSKNTSMKQVAVNIVKKKNKVRQKVLDGVSFDIQKGDFFGIVGRNGSGKSTLLKLIAGVYTPTSGSIEVNGGLTPFIELGVGFNPELSGRDNVYLNGALLGFTRKQMDTMYDEIVEFAELGPFMDQKLKNYSSGMQVRLAFSIAIKAKNDVLIFDEVLAVGDEAFQRKCLAVFEKYKAAKQTVILVTHDMETVRKFCNSAILLSDGKIIESGAPHIVASKYSELNDRVGERDAYRAAQKSKETSISRIDMKITDEHNDEKYTFEYMSSVRLHIALKHLASTDIESVGVTLIKQTGEHLGGVNSRTFAKGWDRTGSLTLDILLDFSPGTYSLLVEVFSAPGKRIETYTGPSITIKAKDPLTWSGLTQLNVTWRQGE